MTDEHILLLFDQVFAAQIRNRDEVGEYVAVEVPPGSPQLRHHPECVTEGSPRGGVLRCVVEDQPAYRQVGRGRICQYLVVGH